MVADNRINAWASNIINAAESFSASSVAVMTALAPMWGMVPDALITGKHMIDIFGNTLVGWGAAVIITPGIVSIGVGLAFARSILKDHGMESESRKIDAAYWFAVLSVAGANIYMSTSSGVTAAGAMESALVLLPIPVSVLVAISAKIVASVRAANDALARSAADKAQEFADSERAKDNQAARNLAAKAAEAAAELEAQKLRYAEDDHIRAEAATERAARRAERAEAKPKSTVAQPEPTTTGATTAERAASWITGYYVKNGTAPKLAEICAAIGVKNSQASKYRTDWQAAQEAATK